ncbi:APC family permease [Halorarum salinum]|uniref:Amino acid permease n=1 Tax=Halorarum salinum TaxID=2743089 RepID=A0A7D5LCF3_9EURY|nr:APC family permease [Halobaculum salinum]QLG63254.1 amino acid permease [Halobaculum salinum]
MPDGPGLGLTEAVSIALGGMIGGGIYAVLGVVAGITGAATWFAFLLAGVVALCAAHSYVALNEIVDGNGGSVTFVQYFTGNATLAGMVGWTLLFGYVGSMAMYAFAFAEFGLTLPGVPDSVGSVPLRPVVSVLAVAGFVGLNLLGARATGSAENVLVGLKVAILLLFGVGGLAYGYLVSTEPVKYGVSQFASVGPIMAAGVSFVAFQGWQLLFYDQEGIEGASATIRKAVYVSIPVAVLVYLLVGIATYHLAPGALQANPHTALKDAASRMAGVVGMAGAGALVISLSALFSTGSAINATLFSAGYFAKGMLSSDLLPDRVGDSSESGVPHRTLLLLGAVTAAFTAYGSLEAITNFASVAFIVVFGGMSYLAFRNRDRSEVRTAPTAVGTVGAAGFLPVMLYHLYTANRHTFYMVLALTVAVVAVELLYFERDVLEREIETVEEDLSDAL